MGTINSRRKARTCIGFMILISYSFLWAEDLKIAVPNKIKSLNPFKTTIIQEKFIQPLVFESIFFKDINGDLK